MRTKKNTSLFDKLLYRHGHPSGYAVNLIEPLKEFADPLKARAIISRSLTSRIYDCTILKSSPQNLLAIWCGPYRTVPKNGIPFDVRIPDKETGKAMEELRTNKGLQFN